MAGDDGEQEERENDENAMGVGMSRKEKRKALKKMKRKQLRREIALKERQEEEARMNDPEEQMRLLRLEQEEAERMERERKEFEERERRFREELEAQRKRQEEEEERRKADEESRSKSVDNEKANELSEDDDWEYVEEGPAEIIWKGNEIIVKKKKVKVPKKGPDSQNEKQESERPISNPLAPQSEVYEDFKNAQEVLDSVAQQVPNFGTEQDKAHCPFHLKTGVCRFGARCSRVHFYPDKSCTLLMKNMYNGPGLAWEQDEGLEYTDEEVERSFEDFYEDVHTEFLKFGEIVNFKVCKNGSSHLRGNVYVHYKLLESAVLAYQSINGRYFAGKQISCEFVNLMRWKVAICGEYMKSRLKACSHGSACNFIHCFRNPGGDYEWADWDRPAPRYWLTKMSALFGSTTDRHRDEVSPRYRSRRSRSRGSDSGNHSDEDYDRRRRRCSRRGVNREGARSVDEEMREEKISSQDYHDIKHRKSDAVDMSDGRSGDKKSSHTKRSSRKRGRELELTRQGSEGRERESYADKNGCSEKRESDPYLESKSRNSSRKKRVTELIHDYHQGRDKHSKFDIKGSPQAERRHDERNRHKGEHSLPKKHRADNSDTDSQGDKLERDEDRCRRRSKKSSRSIKNEAGVSNNAFDGDDLCRDEKGLQKKKRKDSRSDNRSDHAGAERSRDGLDREDRDHEHGMRSYGDYIKKTKLSRADSKYRCLVDKMPEEIGKEDDHFGTNGRPRNTHSDNGIHFEEDKVDERHRKSSCRNPNDGGIYSDSRQEGHQFERDHKWYDEEQRSHSNISNQETTISQKGEGGDGRTDFQDVYGSSEDDREQAYRLAALKKLEEMRKHKGVQPLRNQEYISTEYHSHDNKLNGLEVSKDVQEPLGSSKMEINDPTIKRRRI